MNLRIAYYVVALAISLAAFAGAYGYASTTAGAAVAAARGSRTAAVLAAAGVRAPLTAYGMAAYGMAAAASLAAFAGAYIIDKRRAPPEG